MVYFGTPERLVRRSAANPLQPFKTGKDQAYGRNFSQYVAALPPKKYTGILLKLFDLADVAHRQKLCFGKVELFFAVPSRVLAVAYSTWIWRC